jgi:hypothetical protein
MYMYVCVCVLYGGRERAGYLYVFGGSDAGKIYKKSRVLGAGGTLWFLGLVAKK